MNRLSRSVAALALASLVLSGVTAQAKEKKPKHKKNQDLSANPLANVKRATAKRARAEKTRRAAQDEWAAAIREASAAGASTREIATIAGVSHVFVAKLLKGDASDA